MSDQKDDAKELDDEQLSDVSGGTGGTGIVSPRDPATGQATGKVKLSEISISKPVDSSSTS